MKRALLAAAALLFLLIGGFCAWRYYDTEILPEKRLDQAEEKQAELFSAIRPDFTESADSAQASESPLAEAEKVNSGVVGWITVPGTRIDQPIAQAEDNDFYLHNGFDGNYNYEVGCPFLDYRCEADFSGFSSVVYGHHLKKGRMFSDIALFAQKSQMEKCPVGYLTAPDGRHTVRFFAYLNVPSNAPAYHTVFVTDAERADFLDYIFSEARYTFGRSRAETGTDVRLLLLSTCTYEFENARGVLVGLIE